MDKNDLIESIIKEVKRVLTERGISVEASPQSASSPASVSPVKQSQATPSGLPQPAAVADNTVGSRDMTGKQVITQKDLETFRDTSIRVTKKAVITPLAFDYAREKGITITRVEESSAAANNKLPATETVAVALVISPDFPGNRVIVTSILNGKGFDIRDLSGQNYETAVKKLSDTVVSGGAHFGVCIEKTGMEGPIHANRNPAVRAVHCRTDICSRAARVDYNANVIVIDSTSDPDAVISGFCGM